MFTERSSLLLTKKDVYFQESVISLIIEKKSFRHPKTQQVFDQKT